MQQRICDRGGKSIDGEEYCKVYRAAFEGRHQTKQAGRDLCPECDALFSDFMRGVPVDGLKDWSKKKP